MIAIGIDPGIASCGFVALDEQRRIKLVNVFESTPTDRPGDTQSRLADMLTWVDRRIDRVTGTPLSPEDLVVVEWPMIGGRNQRGRSSASSDAQKFAAAGALIGMLRSYAGELIAPVPVSWRTAIAGGRVPTEDVHALLEHDYALVEKVGKGKARHALDALGCALYGLKLRAERLALEARASRQPSLQLT